MCELQHRQTLNLFSKRHPTPGAWPLISSLNLSPCRKRFFPRQRRKLIQYLSSFQVLRVVFLRTILFLQSPPYRYVLFIYENCIDSYDIIWMYISSLNFLVKSLSIGKMWRGFWCSHRYINIYVAMFEDLDTGAAKEVELMI